MPYRASRNFGQPVQIEPPDRIGQKLSDRERPGLPIAEQLTSSARAAAARGDRCGCARARRADTSGAPPAAGKSTSQSDEPQEPERAGGDERRTPSPVSAIHGTTSGVTIAPTFVPGVEDPRRERALARRKPLGDRLDRRREIPRLAEAEREARRAESRGGSRASACDIAARLHTTTAPANPRRVPMRSMIRPATRNPSAYAIVNHETMSPYCCSFQPSLALQRRRENAEHLAIDVVDRRREKEQRADRPAIATDLAPRAPAPRSAGLARRHSRCRGESLPLDPAARVAGHQRFDLTRRSRD